MAISRFTLIVPQLLWPEPRDGMAFEQLRLPALEGLLAHGRLVRAPIRSFEETLSSAFGLTGEAPLAALRLLGESSADKIDGHWFCADPVHLKFHQERIVLADAGAFAVSADEARALVAELNREFADIGLIVAPHPERWYLRLAEVRDYLAPPLSAIAGRTLDGTWPQGADAPRLKRWLNEVQMFLHLHPVNQAREQAGQPMVNSLWLWGGSANNHATTHCNFTAVWSTQPLANGLARMAGLSCQPPETAGTLRQQPGHHLVVLAQALMPALYEDHAGWRAALAGLEADWFAPLAGCPLTLIAPTAYGLLTWHCAANDRLKFWRRPQALGALVQQLAL